MSESANYAQSIVFIPDLKLQSRDISLLGVVGYSFVRSLVSLIKLNLFTTATESILIVPEIISV